ILPIRRDLDKIKRQEAGRIRGLDLLPQFLAAGLDLDALDADGQLGRAKNIEPAPVAAPANRDLARLEPRRRAGIASVAGNAAEQRPSLGINTGHSLAVGRDGVSEQSDAFGRDRARPAARDVLHVQTRALSPLASIEDHLPGVRQPRAVELVALDR